MTDSMHGLRETLSKALLPVDFHRLLRLKEKPCTVHAGCDDRGFSLIEVLIAITILSFGLLAIGSMQLNSIKKNAEAQKFSTYGAAAQTSIEMLMSASYDDVTANMNNSNSIDYDGYYLKWMATNVPDFDGVGFYGYNFTANGISDYDFNGDGFEDFAYVSVVVFIDNPPAGDLRNGERLRLSFLKSRNF